MRWNSNDDTLPKTNFYGFSSCLLYIHCAIFDYYFIETGLLAYIFDPSRSTMFNMLLLQKYIYILHDFHLDHVRLITTLFRFVHVFQYLFSYKSTASGPGNNPTMIQLSQEPKHHYLISCHLATRRFVIESGTGDSKATVNNPSRLFKFSLQHCKGTPSAAIYSRLDHATSRHQ